jgi:hypothetical protein
MKPSQKTESSRKALAASNLLREPRINILGLSVPQVAQAINCCERLVWREINEGRMAHVRVRRRVIVTTGQLEDYLQRNSVQTFDANEIASEILDK